MCINRISKLFALVGAVLTLGACDELGDVLNPSPDPEQMSTVDVELFGAADGRPRDACRLPRRISDFSFGALNTSGSGDPS